MKNEIAAPDLTQRPPRSARTRLGGYALLPRMLDKGRATIVGTNGEYRYDCPLDQHILNFLGLDAVLLKEQLATGKGDGEILDWIKENAANKHSDLEIKLWSDYQNDRGPSSDAETLDFFVSTVGKISTTREDITTWAALLDADDFVSFGGKA